MRNRYRTAFAQLRELTGIENGLNAELAQLQDKLSAIRHRKDLLLEYLRNEAQFVTAPQSKEITNELESITHEPTPTNGDGRRKNAQSFNRSQYILFTVSSICKRNGCTSGDVVAALRSSPRAEYFDNPASIYAALNKFVKRGFLSKKGDRFNLTKQGAEQAKELASLSKREKPG